MKSGFTSLLHKAYFLVYAFKREEDQVQNLHPILGVGERCIALFDETGSWTGLQGLKHF